MSRSSPGERDGLRRTVASRRNGTEAGVCALIAIDANVLLRYLLRDDESQAERARRIFERTAHVLITDVVLAETLWTLMGRRYDATRSDLIAVVDNLLQEPNVCFENDEVVWSALQAYRETDADFADALIVYKAAKTAMPDNGVDAVYTFDVAALQLPNTAEP